MAEKSFAERTTTKELLPRSLESEGRDSWRALAGLADGLQVAVETADREKLLEICGEYPDELRRIADVLESLTI